MLKYPEQVGGLGFGVFTHFLAALIKYGWATVICVYWKVSRSRFNVSKWR
jgi:hypothetical protein